MQIQEQTQNLRLAALIIIGRSDCLIGVLCLSHFSAPSAVAKSAVAVCVSGPAYTATACTTAMDSCTTATATTTATITTTTSAAD